MAVRYHLLPRPAAPVVPELDEDQQRVVDHPGGPLLVLAGPGTGKTTTLVEAIVDRVERGARPDQVLALTFSRQAAEQLRDRVTARLGRTLSAPICSTFHSYSYGLIRRYAPAELYDAPLRLLSAPEQDVVLRELLTETPESVVWPESLHRAVRTRGFAKEVHDVLSRAREKGVDGSRLRQLGTEARVPELAAAGLFLDQYLTILDAQGATDYSDLIRRAVIEAADHRDELRDTHRHVFVDEYQDTDPGQVALLRWLAGDGRDLVVVGDPHQSIYGFRGAEIRGILEFPTEFARADGAPADVVALRTTRRFGSRILLASQRVAARIALPGTLPEAARSAFLTPRAEPTTGVEGRVVVRTFDTDRAESEHLADLLRRAHLEDDIAWDQMAVLVRSGRQSIPALRRSLAVAGVPVEVAGDEVPLVRDPAVLPLVDALRLVTELDRVSHDDGEATTTEPPETPETPATTDIDPGRIEALLMGPLGGLDAGDLRRLVRRLRDREKQRAVAESRPAARSRDLVARSLIDPGFLSGLEGPEVEQAVALNRLLHATRAGLDAGDTAEDLLWQLWSGTTWPTRLRAAVERGGGAARWAHRDLDSVCALFDVSARAGEQRHHLGVREFLGALSAQEIPADTLDERAARGAAVRLLTAHRSKGLEWELVVVAHVQQEGWPDLRRRATLLHADQIGRDGLIPPVSTRELLHEERRLFYVACTRARQRLVVTAVASPDDDGEQPSRFLDELGVNVDKVVGRPTRPLSVTGLVSELRRTVADPDTAPALRDAAARRLARLAGERHAGRQLVAAADPATWWGTRGVSRSEEPVRDPAQPVPISASVLESLICCPTAWFLEREAGGVVRAHQSANLGDLVHALAQRVADGDLEAGPDDVDVLMAHIDTVWERLEFRTPWSRAREHARVRAAITRFLDWHHADPRTVLQTEAQLDTVVELDDGESVRLVGYADGLELDSGGRVVVVDLKTTRSAPTGPEVERNVQLGLYQLAVDHGAASTDGPVRSGGAELVQLGLTDGGPQAKVQHQAVQDDDSVQRVALRGELARAAGLLREETFPAVVGAHCRDCSFVPICPAKSAGSVVS